jgi:hypothetical protein
MQAVTVAKLEMQLAPFLGPERHDVEFFEGFPQGGVERGFAGVDLSARSIDFACTKSSQFMDEENLFLAQNEEESGTL